MYTYEFINYPLSSIVLHVNLYVYLVMNLWWVPFYHLVCVPDYSFLCVKDKIYKLNFLTLLCVRIFTHHKDLSISLLSGQCSCVRFSNIYSVSFFVKLHFPITYKYFSSCAFMVAFL